MNRRVAVTSLSISAALVAAIGVNEGWTERPVIPVKGDVPTIYNGITWNAETGKRITMQDDSWTLCNMGDSKACGVRMLTAHLVRTDDGLKNCVKPTAQMTQGEWDILHDFAHQYGVPATCKSSIVRNYNAAKYEAACHSYLKYKFVDGYDCSTAGNKHCYGVWTRQLDRFDKCMNEVRNADMRDGAVHARQWASQIESENVV